MIDNDIEDVLILPLSRGKVARISSKDAELAQFKYSCVGDGSRIYAVRSEKGDNKKKIYLAPEIMQRILGDFPMIKGDIVIHIDGNRLNNTRANLDCPKAYKRKALEQS